MAARAKIRSLHVRPIQSVDLAFESQGTILRQHPARARLGERVRRFDITEVHNRFREVDPKSPERLLHDAGRLADVLGEHALFGLNNEALRAQLQQSILQRENAFLERYRHVADFVSAYRETYASDGGQGKLELLSELRELWRKKSEAIQAEYTKKDKAGVASEAIQKTRHEEIRSQTTATVYSRGLQMRGEGHTIGINYPGAGAGSQVIPNVHTTPRVFDKESGQFVDLAKNHIPEGRQGFLSEQIVTEHDLTTVSLLSEFRHPLLEDRIQFAKSQVELLDENLANRLFALRVPNLERILHNEADQMDWEIVKLQTAFCQTFLISPIDGLVTAIYKDLGETVAPGEAVIRVENDDRILLVGFIQHRGALSTGRPVRIHCDHLFESGDRAIVKGELRSVRGHDADDDEWDVIIECDNSGHDYFSPENPGAESIRLPLNYHFDRDTTEITVG